MLNSNIKHWFIGELANSKQICESNPLLRKLTVVIPTFERQEYLLRAVLFWANSSASLIIVDGSQDSLPEEILGPISNLPNVKYIHEVSRVENRLSEAAKRINTEYAITMGDDEFHLKSGIVSAIKKLEEQPDAVGCIGQSISFSINKENYEIIYGEGYPHKDYIINQDHAGDRLIAAMTEYNAATCYAVLRRVCWQKSWGGLKGYSSIYALEIQQAIICYIQGKIVSVNSLYWLRSYEVQPIHNKDNNRKLSFNSWWENHAFSLEKQKFVSLLVNEMIENEGCSQDEAQLQITAGIHEYLRFYNRQSIANSSYILSIRRLVSRLIRTILSEYVIDNIKKAFGRSISYTVHANFNYGTLNEFITSNVDCPYKLSQELVDELRFVERIIKDFNQKK